MNRNRTILINIICAVFMTALIMAYHNLVVFRIVGYQTAIFMGVEVHINFFIDLTIFTMLVINLFMEIVLIKLYLIENE